MLDGEEFQETILSFWIYSTTFHFFVFRELKLSINIRGKTRSKFQNPILKHVIFFQYRTIE